MDLQRILDLNKGSPMIRQYIRTKLDNPDAIIFYRLGDFYEFFFQDAVEMSKVLDLTLTGKDCSLEERAPMCGIPYHSAESYINKLITLGYKVAICEQTTDPSQKKKASDIVTRDIVRIITPGTIIDENLLDNKRNNYLACIYNNDGVIGFSYMDITTGEYKTTEFLGDKKYDELNDILVRLLPSEVLCYTDESFEDNLAVRKVDLIPKFSYDFPDWYNLEYANFILSNQFSSNYIKEFDLLKKNHSIISCGVLFAYIMQTQKRDLSHINMLGKIENNKYMVIDINTRRNLEILYNFVKF